MQSVKMKFLHTYNKQILLLKKISDGRKHTVSKDLQSTSEVNSGSGITWARLAFTLVSWDAHRRWPQRLSFDLAILTMRVISQAYEYDQSMKRWKKECGLK